MPRCLNCKQKFEPKRFLQKHCESADCEKSAQQYLDDKIAKALKTVKQKKKQDWNKEKIEIKEKLKSLSDWKNDLQREINVLIREIDKGHPCIATGNYQGQMHCGHYLSVGSNPTLRFHLENMFIQSMHSNTWKSGDTIRYQQGIKETFGIEYLDYMNSLQSVEPLKLTSEEIKEKIPIVRSLIKWVKLQERKFTTEERISLRKRFNQEIGIYNQ